MQPRLLLDTHVLVRWLVEPRKLSKEQSKVLERAVLRVEPVALSAVTLLEIAVLVGDGRLKLDGGLEEFFDELQANPVFRVLPLSYEIAAGAGALGVLRDPADRAIVATARAHHLKLVTSDQRILASGLVPAIE